MNRHLLVGAALGAGCASAAYFAAAQIKAPPSKPSATVRLYELGYQRSRSTESGDFKDVPDPFEGAVPSRALTALAASCGVSAYKLDAMDYGGLGGNPSAFLYVIPAALPDATFNCLSERLRPPYLSLRVVERCRSFVEKNPAAPPCQEPTP